MEGVIILLGSTSVDTNLSVVLIWLILPVIVGVMIGAFIDLCTDYDYGALVATLGIMIGILSLPINLLLESSNGETTYKVTVSDCVSLTEFYERYEIIDQDGLSFEIRERK